MKKQTILLSAVILLGLLLFCSIQKVFGFAGKYIYPQDDAYVHLSMAKNFAASGIWGITQYEFSSSSSSPFFTFLLAVLIKVFGNRDYIPLVANGVAGIFLIWIFHNYLKQFSKLTYAVFLFAIVLLMPLHLIIMTGMEYVFQTLTVLLVLLAFQKYQGHKMPRNFSNLALLSILAAGFRYESLFFIFFISLYLFVINKEYVKSIALGLFAITPVVIYGWISLSHGSSFLPDYLVLKGNTNEGIGSFSTIFSGHTYQGISVLLLIVILIIQIFIKSKESKLFSAKISRNAVPIIILCGCTAHLLFADFGLPIYQEAYLVVLILFAAAPFANQLFEKETGNRLLKFGMIFLLSITFFLRFIPMQKYQLVASENIFGQQIQTAGFVHKYYNNSRIITNDCGAISYFNNIQLLDKYSLEKENQGKFINSKIPGNDLYDNAAVQGFELALVFGEWVKMPDYFTKIGSLTIQDNYICRGSTVFFYSVKKENAEKLRNQLTKFSKEIPKDVIINIIK